MSRRNRRGHPISLFAFQDIITAVSGILIMMVLMLTLELVNRSSASSPPALEQAVLEDLRAATAQARRKVAQLQRRATDQDRLLNEVASTSRHDLEEAIAARQHELERLSRGRERAQLRADQLAENVRAAKVERFDLKDEREALKELKREIADLRQELAFEQEAERPIFSLPEGIHKEGWLAVISGAEIRLASLDRAMAPISFSGDIDGLFAASAAEKLLDWINESGADSLYIMLLIRPEGIRQFARLQTKFDQQGIAYGYDVIPREKTIFHPTRGTR